MNIDVSGHHLELTDALKSYVMDKMDRLERHFDHVTKVHVVLGVEKTRHKAEATLHVPGGQGNLHANSVNDDMYAAIDALIDKLDRQILKHKEKVTDHHRRDKIEIAQ
ncbi:MAG: ribosome-associated translation inhibitor RaiA [Gammaproteobacteria bacterium]|nr:ribosome-associated translation inhibitor RaiA [Gammaproteobacteria bacterium]